MEKILTVVIPTYNMEKLLDRSLTSLILEDKDCMDKLEVLVVIDGAKDRSSEIAHTYQDRYPSTFKVIDKENGNYGSCINRGLKEAKGKYMRILDADDYYDTKNLLSFLMKLSSIDADLVVTDYTIHQEEKKVLRQLTLQPNQLISLSDTSLNPEMFKFWFMHMLTVRTDLLRQIEYKQTEGISYTDNEWIYYPLFAAKDVVYFDLNVYQYILGREGQTMNPAALAKGVKSFVQIGKRMIDNYIANVKPLSFGQELLIKKQLKSIYMNVAYIALYDFPVNSDRLSALADIDNSFKSVTDLYDETAQIEIGGIKIIDYWRKNGKDARSWSMFGVREFIACLMGKRKYSVKDVIFN